MTVMDARVKKVRSRVRPGSARPDLRLPLARPRGVVLRGARVVAKSCSGVARRPSDTTWLLRLKVGAVAVLSVAAATMSVVHLATPEEPVGYVAGDPAWAHVTPGR
ncbi:MAG TPA: hypothetical protein PKE40_15645 [Arachnia sp.]|nr:hypothetical protein [Arachnia sp.]HMT87774.1 hypothetical protein [Arachnia sp.]